MRQLISRLDRLIYRICQWPVFTRFKFLPRFIKFCLIGIVNTVVDFFIFFSLTWQTAFFSRHYLWANFIAFCLANFISFWLNKYWTFNNRSIRYFDQYYKFLAVSALALLSVQVTLFFLISKFGFTPLLAKLVALFISAVVGFIGSRWWAFKYNK